MDKWISILDKLPEEGEIVVVWFVDLDEPGCVRVGFDKGFPIFYDLISVDVFDNSRASRISHWMSLPKPPEVNDS